MAATSAVRTPVRQWWALIVLGLVAVGTQVALAEMKTPSVSTTVTWVRSPELMRRLSIGFSDVWADVYWIRAVQYFGGTKLSTDKDKTYDRLYPLLDITTTLDPRFNIAYRLGAILLSEGYPNGAGNTDLAIMLLEKGMREMPDKWQYPHDVGFVAYWWRKDLIAAAQWFQKAADVPGAPNWLRPLAATMVREGGDRELARKLLSELATTGDHEWLRDAGRRGLMKIEAEEVIEVLQPVVNHFYDRTGRFPSSWDEMVAARLLRRVPVDPSGIVYALDPVSGAIDVSEDSSLYPLRK